MSGNKKKSPFGAYDVRGVYGETLTEELAEKLGIALCQYLNLNGGQCVIGHDVRGSSPALAKALAKGLKVSGNRVI